MSSGVLRISFMTCPDSFRRSRSWSPVAAARRGLKESHNDVSSKALVITRRNVLSVLRLFTKSLLCWSVTDVIRTYSQHEGGPERSDDGRKIRVGSDER